jgi:hypothetical protein
MSERAAATPYQAPAIDERAPIGFPLIGAPVSTPTVSAVFRPAPAARYEPPTIEERVPVSIPLIGLQSNQVTSAAFRPL